MPLLFLICSVTMVYEFVMVNSEGVGMGVELCMN